MAAEVTEYESTTWLRRVRSSVLLVLLVVVLGAVAAGVLGVAAVTITSLVDHALG